MSVEVSGAPGTLERVRGVLLSSPRSVADVIATHQNNFNIVRFILAASVIYFHAAHLSGTPPGDWFTRHLLLPVTDLGGMAVQCFFFLSGVFVTQSIIKDRNLIDYAIKRAMRIFPGLFICMLVTTPLLAMLSGWEAFGRLFRTPEPYTFILSNASLNLRWTLPTVLTASPDSALNGPIHTLPTELKMYVMLGMLGLFGAMSRRLWVGAAALVALVAAAYVGAPVTTIWRAMPDAYAMIMMFLAGMLVFALADRIFINLAQGVVLLLLILLCKQVFVLRCVATYSFAAWAMLYVGQHQGLRRLFSPTHDTSYGVYVYGWPSQQLVKALIPAAGSGAVTILGLTVAFAFALLSWIYVERPAMDAAKTVCKSPSKFWAMRAVFSWSRSGSRSLCIQLVLLVTCTCMAVLSTKVQLLQREVMPARIVGWAPSVARAGRGFNVQPDGSWAMWVKFDGRVPAGSAIVLSGHWLQTTTSSDHEVLSAIVPKWLVLRPGSKRIEVYALDMQRAYRSNIVNLEIVK